MEEDLPQSATWEQRQTYFLVSAGLLWIGAMFLAALARDWLRKDSPLRARIFQPFVLGIVADCLFTTLYGIYHTYNTIFSQATGEDPISDPSGAVCKMLGFFTLFSAVFICIGIAVAWASILQIVKDTVTFDVANNYNPWLYNGGGFALALVYSTVWYAYALASDTQGVFMGLFCCVDFTTQGNAGIAVLVVSASFGASAFFAFKSHQLVTKAIEKVRTELGESLETHRADPGSVAKDDDVRPANVAARNLGALALATSIGYVLTWGLLGLLCLLLMFGVELGNIVLLVGSAFIKLRAPVDVILIFRSATYRSLEDRARIMRESQVSSAFSQMSY